MKKIIIGVFALAFAITSAARADVAISGFFQQIIGMGDDTTGGITHEFDRINFVASTTTDNGWEVGGKLQHEPTLDRTAGPTALQMHVTNDLGTLVLGNTTDAVTNTMSRIAAMVPGGGTDAGYQYLFFGGTKGDRGVRFAEAYYAMNGHRAVYTPPSINGVNISISYTPTQDENTMSDRDRTTNGGTGTNHQETVEVAANYSGDLEGVGYTIAIGSKNGNGIASFGNTANDLNVITGTIQLTQGAWTLGYMIYDNGDSFGASDDSTQASSSGWVASVTHAMGNIVIGAGYSEMEAVNGTRYDLQAGTNNAAAGAQSNVQTTNITNIGISYNLGGGVGTYIQMSDYDINDGNSMTTETSPQVIFAGISLGF
jgi:hypothetical protein